MRSICLLLSFFIVIPTQLHSIITVKGNQESDQTTFSFPIEHIKEDSVSYLLYTGAGSHQPESAKEFAIASIDQTTGQCIPLAPKTVTLNITESDQPNPLFDSTCKDLAVMQIGGESLPVVLTTESPNKIFMYESTFPNHISLLESKHINDAHSVPTPALNLSLLSTDNNGHILTCTTPSSGNFGDEGSGIALVVRGFKQEENVQIRAFQQINPATGNIVDPAIALPFDKNSQIVTFNNSPLTAVTPSACWWDNNLQRWYIGISGTGNAAADDGIRTVVVGRLSGHKLILEEFVPTSAFDGTNNDLLIGKKGNNQSVVVTDIVTMHTSKNTAYLVIRGNQNKSSDIQVVQIAQSDDQVLHGKAASKNSTSEDIFVPTTTNISVYQKTVTATPVTTPSDLPLISDPATIPGGGILLQGIVTSMKTVGDTLYVSTNNSATPELNGIYQTTAIVEPTNGHIVGWSQWEPVLLLGLPLSFATINRRTGTLQMLTQDSTHNTSTLIQTQWVNASQNNCSISPLNDLLQTDNTESLQKFLYWPATTPGIAAGSCAVFLYEHKIVLSFLTHTTVDNIQQQTTSTAFANVQNVEETTTSLSFNANTLRFTKDKLGEIGIPTCSCIGYTSQSDDAWLIIGGTNGIALISSSNGKGWSLTNGIGDNFTNLPSTYTHIHTKKMDNIKQVQSVDGFLFVLTDAQLIRIPLNPNTLLDSPMTIIADKEHSPFQNIQAFTDVLISGPVALLGSTNGLWTNLANTSISTLTGTNDWFYVELPEGAPCIECFHAITKTGYSGDVTTNQGGMVYVYNKDISGKKGRIHRLYCNPTLNNVTHANTVQLFNDRRLENTASHLLDLGAAYNKVESNGNTFFALKNALGLPFTTISLSAPETANGHNPYLGLTQWTVPLIVNAPAAGLYSIAGHGSIIIADSQQLYVNQ